MFLFLLQKGHGPSCVAHADLLYYGARGLPRDQAQALQYYHRAAAAVGDPSSASTGMCGVASMTLKGEGTEKNVTYATELYESAIEKYNSVQALNGLGYLYFYGQEFPKNETKAFGYFLQAAETELDGDSLFNTGFCLEHGLGVSKDPVRASHFYLIAAKKFGAFDAVRGLAGFHMMGVGLQRSARDALPYITAAVDYAGPWAKWVRRGLDQFLNKDFARSLMCYLHAGEMGAEVSQSNAAFILRRTYLKTHFKVELPPHAASPFFALAQLGVTGVANLSSTASLSSSNSSKQKPDDPPADEDVLSAPHLMLRLNNLAVFHGNVQASVALGYQYFQGEGVARDYDVAEYYFNKASAAGDKLGSFYIAMMSHLGVGGKDPNIARAKRFYGWWQFNRFPHVTFSPSLLFYLSHTHTHTQSHTYVIHLYFIFLNFTIACYASQMMHSREKVSKTLTSAHKS